MSVQGSTLVFFGFILPLAFCGGFYPREERNYRKTEIVIAGLFPTSHSIESGAIGRGVRPAVELALELVNKDTNLLPNFNLNMTWNDTECDMAKATKVFFDMMYENTTKIMLFGDACSNVTGPLAQISKYWNMSQLSYADMDPKLSDRSTYNNFFRTVPSDSNYNPARIALLRYFNWTRVGTIFQDASTGSDKYGIAHHRLIDLLQKSNIHVVKEKSFLADPESAVMHLKREDARIILGYFDHSMAKKVFCSAFKFGLFGAKYQWIILGDYITNWWENNIGTGCTQRQLLLAMEGYISTDVISIDSENRKSISGLTPREYVNLYNEIRGEEYSKYHGYAFDGIWTIALAMNKLLRTQRSELLTDKVFRGKGVAIALNNTDFLGVTGRVKFDGSDRIGTIVFEQFQGGRLVTIGEYRKGTDQLILQDNIKWQGGSPPRDRNFRRWDMVTISVLAYTIICLLSAVGIVMATIFLIFNVVFRNHRYIKMSSPNMNNIIILGCILSYVSIFLMGSDCGVMPTGRIHYVCIAQSWVLSIGFSLAFGAMFGKTWRVHSIFTNVQLNKKVAKDYKLFIMVFVLVLIDAAILITWEITDSVYSATKELPSEVVGEFEVVPVLEYCTSHYIRIWMGILYAYKGLLLIFGCFLAYETRNVNIPALNDSKYIGMSVYNVVIMCICGAAVSFTVKEQPTTAFIIISLFIIFCTTITLCLVFVPKLIELKRDPSGEERRIRATLNMNKKRKQEQMSCRQLRIFKDLTNENFRNKTILRERTTELKRLLAMLDEDISDLTSEPKPPSLRKLISIRYREGSPGSHSKDCSTGDVDTASMLSDNSAFLSTYTTDSPSMSKNHYLRSTKSINSAETAVTEAFELSESIRSVPSRMENKPDIKDDDSSEDNSKSLPSSPKETDRLDLTSINTYGYTDTQTESIVATNDKMVQAGQGHLMPYAPNGQPCQRRNRRLQQEELDPNIIELIACTDESSTVPFPYTPSFRKVVKKHVN